MSRTTAQLRTLWAPPCTRRRSTVHLHSGASISVAVEAVEAFRALDAVMAHWNYHPRPQDTGAFNCRRITGGTGYSLHAYAIAGDFNWATNPYGPRLQTDMPRGMVNDILAIRTNRGVGVFRWGGDYSDNKDAMHYEVVASPAELQAGINWGTVRGGQVAAPAPPAQPKPAPFNQAVPALAVKEGSPELKAAALLFFEYPDTVRGWQLVVGNPDDNAFLDQIPDGSVTLGFGVVNEPAGSVLRHRARQQPGDARTPALEALVGKDRNETLRLIIDRFDR